VEGRGDELVEQAVTMRCAIRIVLVAALALPSLPLSAQIRIAVLGDSYASGEGNPDVLGRTCVMTPPPAGGGVAGLRCGRLPGWNGRAGRGPSPLDNPCHRATAAGFVRAAEQLGTDLSASTGEPVVVETFACSGATTGTMSAGTTTPTFASHYPSGPQTMPGQLSQLSTATQFNDASTGNRIDAIIMSVGANDIGFSGTVAGCASNLTGECYRGVSIGPAIATLPGLYASLQSSIVATLGTRVANVFIVEYYDPSVGPNGPCGATTAIDNGRLLVRAPNFRDLPLFWGISYYESRFASETLVPTLNGAVAAGAAANGWHYVGGVAERFRQGHGHCSSDRWVRNLNDSVSLQGGVWGVVHPNRPGHDAVRDVVLAALAPYRQTLAPPAEVRFTGELVTPEVSWQGGQGAIQQVAFQSFSARRNVALPSLPGFPGDGRRQRVAAGILSGVAGDQWQLREVDIGSRVDAPSNAHWIAAVRSCNTLRCSAWSAPVTSPPLQPRGAWFERSGSVIAAKWTAHSRNGVYQIAIPAGSKKWNVYEVDSFGQNEQTLIETSGLTPVVWNEALSLPPPTGVDRRAPDGREPVAHLPVGGLPVAVTREFHVRGCNRRGCSAWQSGADFINALQVPVPSPFVIVQSPLPCVTNGGLVTCPSEDQGGRGSSWPAVPGTDVYQVAAYKTDHTIETPASQDAFVKLNLNQHLGFRVRACNLSGCSAWSAAKMLDPTAAALPEPAMLAPPPMTSPAVPSGAPPQTFPIPTY
jgi:hypothetical protein